jgi:non-ribosomal peptide synthase protein (TIGR01720 family)
MRQTYPEIEIINGYGPTENTTFSLTYNIKETEIRGTVPIGIPLNNRTAYILNSEQQLVPIGVTGEVYLGGDGLSKGYLNNPELTNEKFIKDIFSKDQNARLYKTGDLGRWLPNGNIEYLGRKDEQVKIRGYRIELGEIEAALNESDFIRNAVVLARATTEGNKRLVGYVVPEGNFDREEIKNYLSKRLPEYMVPAIWVEMESLPLTANGKIDKNALQDPEAGDVLSNEYVAPRNEMETALAGIWKDLLRSERVGIHDNFFELGGDSIITIQVVSRARRLGYEIKPKEIFLHQTIASLSDAIAENTVSIVTGEQGILTGVSGLIPIQQWYFEETDVNVSHFNQSVLLSLEKTVTPEVLSTAVDELIKFHDALRFKYNNRGGEWIQEYDGVHSEKLITLDLKSADKETFADKVKEHSDKYNAGLDIQKGEIVKFILMQTPESETHNRILIVVHHLAIDGVSWRILLEDLELLLNGIQKDGKAELGVKGSSFRQWYEALEQFSNSKRLLSQGKYWENVVSNYKPLEIDKEFNGKLKAKDIESETISLDSIQTQLLLQEVPRVYHTEINDILLCALALTISEWSKNDKVTIGMEGHGRENISESIDTSRTVGWFTSLYPVLLEVNADGNLSDAIRGVKEQLRRIPDKGLGYGVMRYINKNEKVIDASGKESWDIVFNYLGQLDKVVGGSNWLSGAGESAGEFRSPEQAVSEKLSFSGMIRGGELVLSLSYSGLQFNKETIENLIKKYKQILESLIAHCIDQQKKGVVFTPSDYNLGKEISIEELDQFLKVDDKDDIMSF